MDNSIKYVKNDDKTRPNTTPDTTAATRIYLIDIYFLEIFRT